MSHPSNPPPDPDIKLREHVYDGIAEYDQRLPNWWLYTLYGTIVFSIVYWFFHVTHGEAKPDQAEVDAAMTQLAAQKLAASIDVTDDAVFWEMSRNPIVVQAGRQTYDSLCAACHLPSLRGKSENPAAVGPDLTDQAWLHGGTPKEIYTTASQGVLTRGMPAWEQMLGRKKTSEVVAYVLSKHQPGEPITAETSP